MPALAPISHKRTKGTVYGVPASAGQTPLRDGSLRPHPRFLLFARRVSVVPLRVPQLTRHGIGENGFMHRAATTLAPGGCLSAHRRCRRTPDPRGPDEYGAIFNHEVAGLHLAKEPGGGFEPHGARGVQVSHEFPADFSGPTAPPPGPTAMMGTR